MKVAVIGAGYWGKNHVREYLSLGQNVTVCDVSTQTLNQRKKDFPNIQTTPKLEDVLEDSTIECVSVCTPNETHFEIAQKCLNAGKHVLLEKPMALNSTDAKKLVELAKQKKEVFTIGHVFRFNNALIKAKELLVRKELGEVYIAKLTWTNLDPIYEQRDILTDLGLHPIDILHFLFDEKPRELRYTAEGFRKNDGDEAAFVCGKIGNSIFEVELSWLTPQKERSILLVGEKQSLLIDALEQKVDVLKKVGESETLSINPSNALNWELSSFLDAIKYKMDPQVSGEVGLEITEALEEIAKAKVKKRTGD